jgi:hypothetical protein
MSPGIVYRPAEGATREKELSMLTNVYAFILQTHQEKQKGGPATSRPDEPKGSVHDRPEASIHN